MNLTVEDPPCDSNYRGQGRPAQEIRAVRLEIHNRRLPGWMGWMTRSAALQCLGTITFHRLDGQNVFGRSMAVRWAGSPEPVAIPAIGPSGEQFQILDLVRLTSASRMDVYPGEKEALDVAVRMDSDADCYGWSNESYFSNPLWRNPNWRLPYGRYLVMVVIVSSGQRCRGAFRLINDVPRADFRLERVTVHERRLLGQ